MSLISMVESGTAGVVSAVLHPNHHLLCESNAMAIHVVSENQDSVSNQVQTQPKTRVYSLYEIVNTVNGKRYIGITSRSVKQRFQEHLSEAQCGRWEYPLYRAIRKYGKSAFSVSVLAKTDDWQSLCDAEIAAIAASEKKSLYNVTLGGEGNLGIDRTYQTGDNSWARSEAGRAWFASHVSHLSLPAHAERMRRDNPAKRPGVMDHLRGDGNPAKRPEVREKLRANNAFNDPSRRNEAIAKLSAAKKGRRHPWMLGDKNIRRQPEERARISGAGNPNAKAAMIEGVYYHTLQDAAAALGVAQATTIAHRIKRGTPGYSFAERRGHDSL